MSITFPTIARVQRTTDDRGDRPGSRRSAGSLRLRIDLCLADLDDGLTQSEVPAMTSARSTPTTGTASDRSPAHWSERVSA